MLQPSPPRRLSSSHCSLTSHTPFPQTESGASIGPASAAPPLPALPPVPPLPESVSPPPSLVPVLAIGGATIARSTQVSPHAATVAQATQPSTTPLRAGLLSPAPRLLMGC